MSLFGKQRRDIYYTYDPVSTVDKVWGGMTGVFIDWEGCQKIFFVYGIVLVTRALYMYVCISMYDVAGPDVDVDGACIRFINLMISVIGQMI